MDIPAKTSGQTMDEQIEYARAQRDDHFGLFQFWESVLNGLMKLRGGPKAETPPLPSATVALSSKYAGMRVLEAILAFLKSTETSKNKGRPQTVTSLYEEFKSTTVLVGKKPEKACQTIGQAIARGLSTTARGTKRKKPSLKRIGGKGGLVGLANWPDDLFHH